MLKVIVVFTLCAGGVMILGAINIWLGILATPLGLEIMRELLTD